MGPKVSSHSFKSNSKSCKFCIQCPHSIKLIGKFALALLVCVIRFLDQYKMYRFFGSQLKFTSSICVHQTTFDVYNFGGLYLHPMLVFNKNFEFCSPWGLAIVVKFSCQFKLFECLGVIWSSKSKHFWISMNFDSLFLLHIDCPLPLIFLEKLRILV